MNNFNAPNSIQGRLAVYEELNSTGDYEVPTLGSWADGYYWLGTAMDYQYVYRVSGNDYSNNGLYNGTGDDGSGVRPLIIVSQSDVQVN